MLVGVGLAGIVGLLVSLPAMKLSPEYLILLTLAVSSVILGTFTTFPELGGTYGLINLPNVSSSSAGRCSRPSDWLHPAARRGRHHRGSCAGASASRPTGGC